MAIKVQGNIVIDDSQNIINIGVATIGSIDVNKISPDGSDFGTSNYVPVADGSGTWSWQPVTNAGAGILDGIIIKEEGSTVGTAGSITTLNFVGNNITATAVSGGTIATITASDTPTFDTLGIGTRIDLIPYDTIDNGTLSFEGSAGQLFSITNNLSSGSIFSVNDVSGIPSIDVDADGTIQLAPYGSTEYVGIGTTNPTAKLDINGTLNVTGVSTFVSDINIGDKITYTDSSDIVKFGDDAQLRFGDGNDLQIYHNGSYSYIKDTGTGALIINSDNVVIKNAADNEDIAKFTQDGAVELYYDNSKKFETTADGIKVHSNVGLGTVAGNSQDLAVFRSTNANTSLLKIVEERDVNGTDWNSAYTRIQKTIDVTDQAYIQFNGSGLNYGMEFGTQNDEKFAVFKKDNAVELYYDNAKKFETGQYGVTVTGSLAASNIDLVDNAKLLLGTGDDLQIYHSGSNSYIKDTGTGALIFTSNIYSFRNSADSEQIARFDEDGAVKLYHDNSKKFETTGIGVSIVGTGNTATITGPSNLVLDPGTVGDNTGTVTILGNLQVDGTQTVINSTTMTVDDLNITLADGAANPSAANGAGITVDGASATLTYFSTTDSWEFNKDLILDRQNATLKIKAGATGTRGAVDFTFNTDSTVYGSLELDYDQRGTEGLWLNTGSYPVTIEASSANYIKFRSGTTEHMRITSGGDVGIGTDNPIYKLDVRGDIHFFNNAIIASYAASNNIDHFWHTDSSSYGQGGVWHFVSDSTYKGTGNSAIRAGAFANMADTGTASQKLQITGGAYVSGNLGVGVTNPSTKLDVRGGSILVDAFNTSGDHGIFFRNGFDSSNSPYNISILAYDHSGSHKDGLSINGYDGISFCTGSNTRQERLRITSAGDVGIGTDNPQQKLHVKGTIQLDGTASAINDNYSLIYQNSSGSVDYGLQVKHYQGDTDDADAGIVIGGNSSREGNIVFYRDVSGTFTETARFDEDGDFGIGTNDPTHRLTVNGPSDGLGATIARFRNNSGGNRIDIIDETFSAGRPPGILSPSASYGLGLYAGNGPIRFYPASTTTEKVRIDNSGNLLINTTSATGTSSQPLQVSGGAYVSGSVGIAVTLPVGLTPGSSNTLHLNGSSAVMRVGPYYSSGGDRDNILLVAHSQNTYIRSNNEKFSFYNGSGDIAFHGTSDAEKVRFTAAGDVGIGVTNPSAKLDIVNDTTNDEEVLRVRGTHGNSGSVQGITHIGIGYWSTGTYSPARITVKESSTGSYNADLLFSTRSSSSDAAPAERLRITSAGDVGIGDTNPGAKLKVYGGKTWLDNASGDTQSRANGLTVSNVPNADWTPGTDVNDSRRNTTFASKGSTRAVVVSWRNVDDTPNAFWDFIADGNTDKFYIQQGGAYQPTFTWDTNQQVAIGTDVQSGSTLAVGGTITELYNGSYWNVVTQADVGYGASQVPLNQYLGQLAFLDDYHPNGLRRDGGGSDDVVVSAGGTVGIGTDTIGVTGYALEVIGKVKIDNGDAANTLDLSNGNLINVNHITINDPGPNEGIKWNGGSGWSIYESPNDLTTNSAGNLQFVDSGSRILTLDTSGNAEFTGHVKVDDGPTLENGGGSDLRVTTDYGYIELGPINTSYAHVQTDRTRFYFNKKIIVDEGIISSYNEDLILRTNESGGGDERLRILTSNGYVGINTASPSYQLHVNGSFAATTKSFVIDHPTKDGMKLRYGSLEGPENGVYVRGRLKGNDTIELPDHWTGLVDEETITVNLTPIGRKAPLHSVVDIADNTVIVESANDVVDCFYTVFGERKDVEKLEVEF